MSRVQATGLVDICSLHIIISLRRLSSELILKDYSNSHTEW